ncbi:hypothetical protein L914_19761 [Phytophthora nicotianae]|uniref:Uncharacterized protein n=1 Tax=Phytophthora nicotianae TaxID=4792 RepID=W2MBM6_PHYNI|nr:hypothetical protein L914_19761 [Phytophthora nicotianae]
MAKRQSYRLLFANGSEFEKEVSLVIIAFLGIGMYLFRVGNKDLGTSTHLPSDKLSTTTKRHSRALPDTTITIADLTWKEKLLVHIEPFGSFPL